MATKRLALDKDGNLSYCSVPPDQRGVRGCPHVEHAEKREKAQDFVNRVGSKPKDEESEFANTIPTLVSRGMPYRTSSRQKQASRVNARIYRKQISADGTINSDPKILLADINARGYVGEELEVNSFAKLMKKYNVSYEDVNPHGYRDTSGLKEALDRLN